MNERRGQHLLILSLVECGAPVKTERHVLLQIIIRTRAAFRDNNAIHFSINELFPFGSSGHLAGKFRKANFFK